MFLPIINTVLLLLSMIVGVLRDQLSDPAAQWAKTAHILILAAATLVALVILILLSQATTPAGLAAVCSIILPCSATP